MMVALPMKNTVSVVTNPPVCPASGLHLVADLHRCGCDSRWLIDSAHLESHCLALVAQVGLTAVGSLFHPFGDGAGVTGVVVLAESHLCIHTWPEARYVTLDVYVCNYSCDNRSKAERLLVALQATFAPEHIQLQRIERG